MGLLRKSEASKCLAFCVQRSHLILQFLCLVFCDGWFIYVFVVVLEYTWKHFFNFLAVVFSIWVGIFSCINNFCQQLVLQSITLAIAANNAPHLPEADVIEEIMTTDSNLANEQFKQIVGG